MSPTNVIKLFSFFSKKIILFDKKNLLYLFFNLKILKTLKYTHLRKHRVQFNHVYSICQLKAGLASFFWGGDATLFQLSSREEKSLTDDEILYTSRWPC